MWVYTFEQCILSPQPLLPATDSSHYCRPLVSCRTAKMDARLYESYEVISVPPTVVHSLFTNPYLQSLPRDQTHAEASCQTSRPSAAELLRRKRYSLGNCPREDSPSPPITVINYGFDSATCITQRTFEEEDSSNVSLKDWGRKVLHAHVKDLNKDLDVKESAHNRKGCMGFVKFRWVEQSKSRYMKEALKPRAPSASQLPRPCLRPSFSQDFRTSVPRPKTASMSPSIRAKFARRKQSLDLHPAIQILQKGKDSRVASKPHLSVFDIRDIVQWTSQKRQVWK